MEFLKIGYTERTIWVKVRNFSSANVEDIRHNLMPIIRKKPSHLIIHAGTNDAKRFTSREILDQLLNLKKIVSEQVPDCKVIISTPIIRSDEGKAGLTVSQLTISINQKLILLTIQISLVNTLVSWDFI